MIVSKNLFAVLDLSVNYANQLGVGETIVSATASVNGSGTITVGASPTINSPILIVRVSGGTDGQTDSLLVLATTSTGEVLPATIYVAVGVEATVPSSYSTPEKFSARIGPRIYAGLTGETGTPDDAIAQGLLDMASLEVNLKIGTRYVTPVTAPPAALAMLGSLEEQIALWFGYVRRGIGEQETAASAAKIGYDNAFKTLDAISKATLDLSGAAIRSSSCDIGGGFTVHSECPHFDPLPHDRLFESFYRDEDW
jgi:phage gp36-like protein